MVSRASRLISGPLDFKHVSHIGPETGSRVLIDLPASGSEAERAKRVKSIIEERRQLSVVNSVGHSAVHPSAHPEAAPHLQRYLSQNPPPVMPDAPRPQVRTKWS